MLGQITEALVGIVLGAGISAFVVWRQNVQARELLKIQLEHDAEQQSKQREHERAERERDLQMQMRRDVYLAAIESVAGMSLVIGKAADLDITEKELGAMAAQVAAPLVRVQIVGSPQAISAVARANRDYMSTFTECIKARLPLTLRRIDLNHARQAIDLEVQNRDAAFAQWQTLQSKPVSDANQLNALVDAYEKAEDRRSRRAEQWIELLHEQTRLHYEFVASLVPRLKALAPVLPAAVKAIRADLGAPDDEGSLEAEVAANLQALERTLGTLLENLRRQIVEDEVHPAA